MSQRLMFRLIHVRNLAHDVLQSDQKICISSSIETDSVTFSG